MKKILLIEDNENNIRLMQKVLKPYDYQLTVSTNAVDGLVAVRRVRPHLILLDVGLPDMDGTVIAGQLKSLVDSHEPIILAVTADVSPRTRDTMLRFGCEGVIHKPIDTRAFPEQVAEYLDLIPA